MIFSPKSKKKRRLKLLHSLPQNRTVGKSTNTYSVKMKQAILKSSRHTDKTFCCLIHTSLVCNHGNIQQLLRFSTLSWNYCCCVRSFFLSVSLSPTFSRISGERERKKQKRCKKDGEDRVRTIQYLLLFYWKQMEFQRKGNRKKDRKAPQMN